MLSRLIPLSILATVVSAQLNLSANCTQALTTIATNADVNNCLTLSPLIPLIAGPSSQSVIPPVTNWLTSLCAAGPCSNATLAAIVANATAGCGTELASLGFQPGDTAAVTQIVEEFYPVVRQVACLKDNGTLCVASTLTNIQGVLGNTLSINEVVSVISGNLTDFNLPANVTCTDCLKATYITINQDAPDLLSGTSDGFQQQCGPSFTNGQIPPGITESASNISSTSPNKTSNALTLNVQSGAFALAAISGTFALLA